MGDLILGRKHAHYTNTVSCRAASSSKETEGLLLVPTAACTISKSSMPLGCTVEKMCSLDNLMEEDTGIASERCHASLLS